jgi:hypothetical protein
MHSKLLGGDGCEATPKKIGALGWRLDSPSAVTPNGSHVWLPNLDGNSVTELSASTGAPVRVIHGSGYGFDGPAPVSRRVPSFPSP